MRLIIIGCEYAGKTTLAAGIRGWMERTLGSCTTSFHDHFLPWDPADEGPKGERVEDDLKLLTLDDPAIIEKYNRYVIHYHTHPSFYDLPDHCVVGWYYADAVYGPLYYGFGGPSQRADRQVMARSYDSMVSQIAPDTVLVYLTAAAEVIRQRQAAQPRPYPRPEDVEMVLTRFEEEYGQSLLHHRMRLDTSQSTPEQTLDTFVKQIEPYLTSEDRLRMLTAGDAHTPA